MIKRRFYKEEHGDRGGASDGSTSSSSSDEDSDSPPGDVGGGDGDEVEAGEGGGEEEMPLSPSSGSGYESEDSSGNEVGVDSSGLPVNEEESSEDGGIREKNNETRAEKIQRPLEVVSGLSNKKDLDPDLDSCVLKHKSVFKCRLCPRIVCLSENTIKAHLNSKRHARSKKLLGEGRLKMMLNSDGEVEEEQETHAERHARTLALAQQKKDDPKKKEKGRKKRPGKRSRKKLRDGAGFGKPEGSVKKPAKKRRKVED